MAAAGEASEAAEAPHAAPRGEALAAGGTLRPASPSLIGRAWLVLEMAALYVAAPFAMHHAVHGGHIPLFLALTPVLAVVALILLADRRFSLRREATRGFRLLTLLWIVLVFAAGAFVVAQWVLHHHPGWFLEFPRNRPETFQRIILLYPLMSVLPQEFVYRTFFFHRYGTLFGAGRARWLAVPVNALLFGLGHVVVGRPEAIAATVLTGLLFAWRYASTRSLWAVWLEHTLWGTLVFTVGIGRYFWTGVAN